MKYLGMAAFQQRFKISLTIYISRIHVRTYLRGQALATNAEASLPLQPGGPFAPAMIYNVNRIINGPCIPIKISQRNSLTNNTIGPVLS